MNRFQFVRINGPNPVQIFHHFQFRSDFLLYLNRTQNENLHALFVLNSSYLCTLLHMYIFLYIFDSIYLKPKRLFSAFFGIVNEVWSFRFKVSGLKDGKNLLGGVIYHFFTIYFLIFLYIKFVFGSLIY